MTDPSKKTILSLRVSMLAQGVNIITGLIRTFVFIIFISPSNFGLIALSASITGFIQLIKDFGYGTYIIQQREVNESEIININTRILILGVMAFLITWLLAFPIGKFYNQPELNWILPITGFQFILNSFTIVPLSLLRRQMDFDKIAKIEVGSNIGSLLIGFFLLFFMRNYWVLLYSGVSYFLVQVILMKKFGTWKYKLSNPFTTKLSKVSTRYGSQVTLFNVFSFLSTNLDNILIGKLFGQQILGVYSKGYEFGVTNIEKVKRPVQNVYFSDIANRDNDKQFNYFFQYMFFMVTILLLIVGPALIYTDLMVNRVFGEQWGQLKTILPPFLLSSFIWITMSFADQLLLVSSNMKRYLSLGIGKNMLGSASIIAASFWGPGAIAWSYFVYQALLFVPFCYYSFKPLHTDTDKVVRMLKDTSMVIVTALLAVSIPWLLCYFNWVNSGIALLIFLVLVVILFTSVWRNINDSEPLAFLRSLFITAQSKKLTIV
jgi:polysaccharide transporter, PST family